MASRRWTRLSSETLIDRWWLRLRVDHVRLPSGVEIEEFHVCEYPDWALTIPITQKGEVVMVEQYRYGIERVSLEFPAGAVYAGEAPRQAAARELLEETGYKASDLIPLGPLAVEPSRHTNWAHLFVAHNVRQVRAPEHDGTEDIEVSLVPIPDLKALTERGEMCHGIHVAALLLAERSGHLRL